MADLLETEMFGHVRGAYTDAKQSQQGLVSQADGGTLFLDEIDALSLPAQAALLRFVQDGSYRQLGSETECTADLRIVAATNCNLEQLCDAGEFREDLRYRLEVFACHLPALRARGEDVLLLARDFARQFCAHYGQVQRRLHPDFEQSLCEKNWPGNVRQLENEIHRDVILSADQCSVSEPVITLPDTEVGEVAEGFRSAKERAIRQFEFNYLTDLMARSGGNVTRAARLAGKERRALGKLLKKHGLSTH